MFAAAILFFLVGPTVYAQAQTHEKTWLQEGDPDKIWVPKVPRRVIPLMWPSVMNPMVYEEVTKYENKDEYLEVNRGHPELHGNPSFTFREVSDVVINEYRRQKFIKTWNKIRYLIYWVTNEVPKNGFRAIFPQQVYALYELINKNRTEWIKAVKLLAERLVKAIAVLHHNEIFVSKYVSEYYSCSQTSWLENWESNFECWENNADNYPVNSLFYYFKEYVYRSYDIVTAWLFDYVALHLTTDNDQRSTLYRLKFSSYGSYGSYLSCELKARKLHWLKAQEEYLNAQKDDVKGMADHFFTCKVFRSCSFRDFTNAFSIKNGQTFKFEWITIVPQVLGCRFICTDIPAVPREHKGFVYWSASLTTRAGYIFAPQKLMWLGDTFLFKSNGSYMVGSRLVPRVVEKYFLDFCFFHPRPCLVLTTTKLWLWSHRCSPRNKLPEILLHSEVTLYKNGTEVTIPKNEKYVPEYL